MTVPFMTRLKIFRNSIETDRNRFYNGGGGQHRIKARIRRTSLSKDGFDELAGVSGTALKGQVYIKFYDKSVIATTLAL